MRKGTMILLVAGMLCIAQLAYAELQNVEVGGEVRIRGNYITNTFTSPGPEVRYSGAIVRGRPIGGPFNPNVVSPYDWDDRGSDVAFVEQRTRLHVKADFTENVAAFIELDSYGLWGEDFRSQNYITGVDGRATIDAAGDAEVEIFQGYIEANDMFGFPVRLRVGRQELAFGSQWLVGPRDFAFFFTGLSFDAVRLTYTLEDWFTVDAWWSKLAENLGDWGDADVDFYGVYGTFTGLQEEGLTLDAYWMLVRDDIPIEDVQGSAAVEWLESVWGVDQYDETQLHTVGVRAAAKRWGFDVDAEVAYQFGEANSIGATFRPFAYGDDNATFDNWGLKLDVGYSFDVKFKPRVFAGFRWYDGEDFRDISRNDWLNPFDKPSASINFNRLFSNEITSGFMDLNNDFSNGWLIRGGMNAAITEAISGVVCVTYFESMEDFYAPRTVKWFGRQVPIAPWASWWTKPNDDDLGVETDLFLEYRYTEDLVFEAGWAHMFTGSGLRQGNYVRGNGLIFNGGTNNDDADYVYLGTRLSF